jgi:hypothetical protein
VKWSGCGVRSATILHYSPLPLFSTATILSCHYSLLPLFSPATILSCHYSLLPLFSTATILSCHSSPLPLFSPATILHCHYSLLPLFSTATILSCHYSLLPLFSPPLLTPCSRWRSIRNDTTPVPSLPGPPPRLSTCMGSSALDASPPSDESLRPGTAEVEVLHASLRCGESKRASVLNTHRSTCRARRRVNHCCQEELTTAATANDGVICTLHTAFAAFAAHIRCTQSLHTFTAFGRSYLPHLHYPLLEFLVSDREPKLLRWSVLEVPHDLVPSVQHMPSGCYLSFRLRMQWWKENEQRSEV